MPVKVTDIRKELVFTGGMRPLVIERLDLNPCPEVPKVQVHMRNAKHKLHHKLDPTDL